MTKQEAIEFLNVIRVHDAPKLREAIDMAIKSLERWNYSPCCSCPNGWRTHADMRGEA